MKEVFQNKSSYTPVIQQYLTQKEKAGSNLLLFRLGDFYEAFFDDAEILAKELEITLTARSDQAHPGGKVPMSGIPARAAENYIGRLLKSGIKVAICEQVGDKNVKGPIERQLVRVLTPGNLTETEYLNTAASSFLAAIYKGKKTDNWGLAYVDVSTAEVYITEMSESKLVAELEKIMPAELLIPSDQKLDSLTRLPIDQPIMPKGLDTTLFTTTYRDINFCFQDSYAKSHFGEQALFGFGVDGYSSAMASLGAIFEYLEMTHPESLASLKSINVYKDSDYLEIDQNALKNLEIFETLRDQQKKGSLFGLIENFIATKMGIRMMRKWLCFPHIDREPIISRQKAIKTILDNKAFSLQLQQAFQKVSDLERLSVKLNNNRLNPREMGNLRDSLQSLREIALHISGLDHPSLSLNISVDLNDQVEELEKALSDELPVVSSEGGIFRPDYNSELAELRDLVTNNEQWLSDYESQQREITGIKGLKVTFNKAMGFYIEVTKANQSFVPDNYNIKQNLTNTSRYLTPELKEREAAVLSAESKLCKLEQELFTYLREATRSYADEIHSISQKVAEIDCLIALALMADKYNYICPEINEGLRLDIVDGRHPVIEQLVPAGQFISNDISLEATTQVDPGQIMILTGPNMSGKSTYMKQMALIVLLAQIGSYVPASSATVGLVDKIFTRIGASDNLAAGQSTFMVEMLETAYLLNNLTERSLLLLDEVGRGTSTYDGVAIAWAVVENIVKAGSRSIFATHYHELNGMADLFAQVVNYQVAVQEDGERLTFLRKVIPGGADQSYGLEVARMAGMPESVVQRAGHIMRQMNSRNISKSRKKLIEESVEQIKLI